MKKTPVAIIGFLRKEILETTLTNLSLADGVLDRDIIVYLSAPRNNAEKIHTDAVCKMVEDFKDKVLPNISIVLREKNEGASSNIRFAISETVKRLEGRAIVIEDDVLVSRTFLRYMDEALDYYEHDKRIWCINGYRNPHLKVPRNYRHEVYLNPINMAWGWGIWRDRWESVKFDVSDWPSIKEDPKILERINAAGSHIAVLMDCCYAGDKGAWDAQCSYHTARMGLYCVEPRFSLTKTNGLCSIGSVHKSLPNGTIAKQKYYNFIPKLETYETIMLDEQAWMNRFKYSVRDRRPMHFLFRCIRRGLDTLIGGLNINPIDVQKSMLEILRNDLSRIAMPTLCNALKYYFVPRGECFPYVVWFRILQTVRRKKLLRCLLGPFVYWRYRHFEFKYGIHGNANIEVGPGFHVVHGPNNLNAERIGKNFTVRQFVTIGEHNGGRPTIEDDVTINPSAVVVGPIVLGKGCTIGALSYVSHNVPPDTVVKGAW